MNTATAPSPCVRIGKASVSLIGLEAALHAASGLRLAEQAAADFLFNEIKAQNYVPPGCAEQYREALLAVWRRHCGAASNEEGGLAIRVFGGGCASCGRLHALVIDLLDQIGVAADLEQVHDPEEIRRAGVTMLPALMIGGRLKSAGILPSPAQVEQWLREAA